MIHQLKIDAKYFEMKVNGIKRWEIRNNDRGFMVGDYLGLNEVIGGKETGRFMIEDIVAIVDDAPGVREGYVMLSTVAVGLDTPCATIRPPFGIRNRIADGVITD